MLEPARYVSRSSAFNEIVSAAESHYWDPLDPRYLDFSQSFDLEHEMIMPSSTVPELNCAVVDTLDELGKIRLSNELTRLRLSQLLHGEQGGVSMCANLCLVFQDPGSQEYAANQTREETRHVHALTKYFGARWGTALRSGRSLLDLLNKLMLSGEVYQKIIGMQMIIEGLALGAFASIHSSTSDPLLRRLVRFILADESYHHRFGRVWGDITIPTLDEPQRRQMENWAAACFMNVFQNLSGTEERSLVYESLGLKPAWVIGAMREAQHDPAMRAAMERETLLYRVLAKTLEQSGIITGRTRPLYAAYFDLNSVPDDPDVLMGQGVARETMVELRAIHEEIGRSRRGGPRAGP